VVIASPASGFAMSQADAPPREPPICPARANQFGKAPEELAAVLGWQASHEADYRRYGAIIIDATARWAKS
jgi:hypothetical protein